MLRGQLSELRPSKINPTLQDFASTEIMSHYRNIGAVPRFGTAIKTPRSSLPGSVSKASGWRIERFYY
jgi:hypothetical protein